MKKHFRLTEIYTVHVATKPVELDSEMFPDFKGETEQEFFDYILQNYRELAEDETLSEEVSYLINDLAYGDKEEYYNSSFNYYEGEFQMGELDEKQHKNGYFDAQYTIDE